MKYKHVIATDTSTSQWQGSNIDASIATMTLRQSKSDTNTSQQQTQRQGIDKYTSQRPIQTNHSDRVHQIQIRHVDRVQIQKHVAITYTCLFVCLEFLVPLENFSLIWRRHHCRAVNFDLCSPLMAIEQWGFFSMQHLLWHGASVYNADHLRGPVTLTLNAERLAVELSLPGLTT